MKKLVMVLMLVCASLGLVACTTFEDIQRGLDDLRGSPISLLINKIGYPNGQMNVAGKKLYIWDSSQTVSYTMPVTTYNTGTVNAYGAYGNSYGTYSGTSTSYVPQTANYRCKITVEVDSNERIVGFSGDGNVGGCQRYASALKIKSGSKSKTESYKLPNIGLY